MRSESGKGETNRGQSSLLGHTIEQTTKSTQADTNAELLEYPWEQVRGKRQKALRLGRQKTPRECRTG